MAALVCGTLSACAVAKLWKVALVEALLACLRWQGGATAVALGALFIITRTAPQPRRER